MASRGSKILAAIGVLLALAIVAFFPIALATDRATFCKNCHGMAPFYDAWAQGGHATEAACIDCHVDAGYRARFVHKFVALREVYAEFATDAKYPNYNADVPDERCLRCHQDAPAKSVGRFRHADHLSKDVPCAKCHAMTGHRVSFAALDAAGVLNPRAVTAGQHYVGQTVATAGSKGSAYPGHQPVPCQDCHDMADIQCSVCHNAPTSHFGPDCRLCHANAAVAFKQFAHPSTEEHDWRKKKCVKCHPNGYPAVYCTCHKGRPPRED